jgi:hypothetical protein
MPAIKMFRGHGPLLQQPLRVLRDYCEDQSPNGLA